MRRHVLTGVAFAVTTIALGSVPASACNWRGCGGYDYYAPRVYGYYLAPPIYGYAPPPAYGSRQLRCTAMRRLQPTVITRQLRSTATRRLRPMATTPQLRSMALATTVRIRAPTYRYRDVGWRRW